MQTALLIIDIQNDYFPSGKRELEGSLQASLQARKLLEHFRMLGLPRVIIQHLSTQPGATAFLPSSHGVQIHPNVQPEEGEVVIQKHYPNSFRETPLLETLRNLGVELLVICGMMTHMCVDAGTRAAVDHGFTCLVAQDACATRALSFGGITVTAEQVHLSFLAALQAAYAQVLPTDEILQILQAG